MNSKENRMIPRRAENGVLRRMKREAPRTQSCKGLTEELAQVVQEHGGAQEGGVSKKEKKNNVWI